MLASFYESMKNKKNLMGGAEAETSRIRTSLAFSHKKNPRIFGTKTAGFFHKNGSASDLFMTQRKPVRFFL
jgi:hypothetical protein